MNNPNTNAPRIINRAAQGDATKAISSEIIYQQGTYGELPTFYRYVIIETIFDPTSIDDAKIDYYQHTLNVSNIKFAKMGLPRNTIIGKRIIDGTGSDSEPVQFLFPFFPPTLSLPCQPGEHVWVIFENPANKAMDLGYWLCRITEPGPVDDVNHTHAPRTFDLNNQTSTAQKYKGNNKPKYEFRPGATIVDEQGTTTTNAETITISSIEDDKIDEQVYEKMMTESSAGKLMQYEPVPRYKKRPGDVAFEGTNNAIIVIGRDRSGAIADYSTDPLKGEITADVPDNDSKKANVGMIDLVVGRGQTKRTAGEVVKNSLNNDELNKTPDTVIKTEGDPDLQHDRSRVYIAQRTKTDAKFNIADVTSRDDVSDSADGDGSITIKTDKIRLIARQDIVILVEGANNVTDDNGKKNTPDTIDTTKVASITLKTNGDIIFTPSQEGVIRLGGADASKAILCVQSPPPAGGIVPGAPISNSMGGVNGAGGGTGEWASKVLIK